MSFVASERNAMLDGRTADYAAAYDDDPEGAGTMLDQGAIAFGAASAGTRTGSTLPTFTLTAGEHLAYIAFFNGDPSAGGTLVGKSQVNGATGIDFPTGGTYALDSAAMIARNPT